MTDAMVYEHHPIASIFPMLQGEEFRQLIEDVRANGLLEPVMLYEGKILDGRNRYAACKQAGVVPKFVQFEGSDPIAYVWSLNFNRRHLKSDQAAAAVVKRLEFYEAEARKRKQAAGAEYGRGQKKVTQKIEQPIDRNESSAAARAAKDAGTNRQYVADLKKIKQEDPEVFEKIAAGEKRLVEVKKEKKRQERIKTIESISAGNAELPEGKTWPVIYADPPWRYEHVKTDSRAIENQYPTMSLDDICAMQVPSNDDAILFLWTTSPKLAEGMRVLESWGFTYRTCAVWDKQKIGMGYYFRQQHELLLVGTRGNLPVPEPADRPSSVMRYPRGQHSAKPAEVAELIERMYPTLPKLELFCRSPRPGWDVWGNQSGA